MISKIGMDILVVMPLRENGIISLIVISSKAQTLALCECEGDGNSNNAFLVNSVMTELSLNLSHRLFEGESVHP